MVTNDTAIGALESWFLSAYSKSDCSPALSNRFTRVLFDEQEYRDFVRTLSDQALIKEGKQVRVLSGDGKIVSTMPSSFDEQLETYGKNIDVVIRNNSLPLNRSAL